MQVTDVKIGFFEIEKWEEEPLRKAFPGNQLFFSKEQLTLKNVGKHKKLDVVSVFIYSEVYEDVLNNMPHLKFIATRSTGFDHIDLNACRKKGIVVCNVPTYGENTVAEHTFALILGLSRKLIDCVERTRKGSFELKGLRGFELEEKTIGVVGCGNIGRHVVRIAKGFGMNIFIFDVKKDLAFAKKYGARYVSFNYLLANSDVITFHVPLLPATQHMFNLNNMNKVKKGALLINTSRGAVVSTDALIRALEKKILSGAGLDVLEEECYLKEERELLTEKFAKTCDLKTVLEEHMLLRMPNVIITPHNAFNTHEAMMRILNTSIENIKQFKKGKLVNLVKI